MQANRVATVIVAIACLLGPPTSAAKKRTLGRECGLPKTQGSAFIQAKTTSQSNEGGELSNDGSDELEACRARVAELDQEVRKMQQKLRKKMRAAKTCKGPGTCAIFGDPHFTTFDGAHTILSKQQTLWVVKSRNVSIQALSQESTGDLMGLAVSGPFMLGHTLIFANSTLAADGTGHPFTVLFNGKPILDTWDAEGSSEFELQNIMWAARRADWNVFLHGQQILEMEDAIDFDVGTWESRFSEKPKGGLYLFKFPEGVELTATGADLMSAVVKMSPQEGGQAGYCGNFNGKVEDDFKLPEEGSVDAALAPAWNIPVGRGLEPVAEHLDLFKTSAYLKDFFALPAKAEASVASHSPACSQDLLSRAESACKKVDTEALHAACVADVCRTGDPAAADGVLAIGVWGGELQANGTQ